MGASAKEAPSSGPPPLPPLTVECWRASSGEIVRSVFPEEKDVIRKGRVGLSIRSSKRGSQDARWPVQASLCVWDCVFISRNDAMSSPASVVPFIELHAHLKFRFLSISVPRTFVESLALALQ